MDWKRKDLWVNAAAVLCGLGIGTILYLLSKGAPEEPSSNPVQTALERRSQPSPEDSLRADNPSVQERAAAAVQEPAATQDASDFSGANRP